MRLPATCLRLQRRVAESVARTATLRAGEHALLLLSGGADSMALLSLVRAVDRLLGLRLQLSALHVDYGLRGADSDRDRLIVARGCAGAEVPLYVERLRGRLSGRDFQARARDQRYDLARKIAEAHGCTVIVTAHNRDDQAETILYRLAKYASPRGLVGMRPRERDLARPLLGLGAAEIREYCRAAGIEYGEDVTNAAPLYARNVLRLEVLPRLEALNPRLAETLAASAEQAAAEADVLAEAAAAARARVARPAGRGEVAALDLAALAAEPPALRALVLHDLVRDAMGGEALVERRLVEGSRTSGHAPRRRRPFEPRPGPRGRACPGRAAPAHGRPGTRLRPGGPRWRRAGRRRLGRPRGRLLRRPLEAAPAPGRGLRP